jgi:hypothetical protein
MAKVIQEARRVEAEAALVTLWVCVGVLLQVIGEFEEYITELQGEVQLGKALIEDLQVRACCRDCGRSRREPGY